MNAQHLSLAGRIRSELTELERVVDRIPLAWKRAIDSADDLYFDSTALNLHAFYSGVERLFEFIAREIDSVLPRDSNWHQQLLRQMAVEIPHVRPAVISILSRDVLDEYRSFRHVVRNVYAYSLSPPRMAHLVDNIETKFEQIKQELINFAELLETNHDEG